MAKLTDGMVERIEHPFAVLVGHGIRISHVRNLIESNQWHVTKIHTCHYQAWHSALLGQDKEQ